MTSEPESIEPVVTPETEPPAAAEEPAAPPPAPPVRPTRRFYDAPGSRLILAMAAAVLIFAGGFVAGHWVFERHDHDRNRPMIAARAERFLQGLQGRRDGQSGNGQVPNLERLMQQLLNNRGNGNGNGGSNATPNDVERQLQQLRQQLQQLQDQLKATPTPATPR